MKNPLLMSNLQATVRSLAAQNLDPADLTERVNRLIGENTAPDRFITFFYAVFDAQNRRMLYTNAGHNAPIALGRDGSVRRLSCGGQALSISAGQHYEQEEIVLTEGDRLVLFTDGITETTDRHGEEFGETRLLAVLQENRALGAAKIQKNIDRKSVV